MELARWITRECDHMPWAEKDSARKKVLEFPVTSLMTARLLPSCQDL